MNTGESRSRLPGWMGDSAALLAGAAANGLAAYAFIALGTREYGAADFAPVSVLWSIWAVTGAAITFPVQHEVTRRLESGRGEAPVRDVVPQAAVAVLAIAAGVTVVAWAAAEPLFGTDQALYPLTAGWIVAGGGLSGFVRGSLAGRRRFLATGSAIGAENVLRLGAAVVVVAAGWDVEAYTVALALGPAVLVVWIGSLRFAHSGRLLAGERGYRGLARTFGGLAGASAVSQVVLTSGPVVLALAGGAPSSITSLFAALAVFRAPYLLLLGATARITGVLTRLEVAGGTGQLARVRWSFAWGSVLVAGLFAAFAVTGGEATLQLLFGPTVDLARRDLGLVGVGTGLALGAVLLVLLLAARGRATASLWAWLVALAVGALILVVTPTIGLTTVLWAFVAAELVAVAALTALDVVGSVPPRRPASQGPSRRGRLRR